MEIGQIKFYGILGEASRLAKKKNFALLSVITIAVMANGCGGWWRSKAPSANVVAVGDATTKVPSTTSPDSTESIIRELEARVKQNPDDFIAFNKLGGYYLQRLRETGNVKYLELAGRASRASLAVLPAIKMPAH